MVNTLIFAYAGSELGSWCIYTVLERIPLLSTLQESFLWEMWLEHFSFSWPHSDNTFNSSHGKPFYAKHKGVGREKFKHVD